MSALRDLLSDPDRLALARALVADMPGVVVAKVPQEMAWWEAPNPIGRRSADAWADGFNAAIAAFISAGSATHQPKEDGA